MAVTYQQENFRAAWAEIQQLLNDHWREVALNHDDIPLDPDEERYFALCDSGALHLLTARSDGELVGYHISIISGHLHYRSTPHAFVDVYFLKKPYRRGMTGVRLIKEAEKSLKALGAKKIFTGTKLHDDLDRSKVFERLGYKLIEHMYAKLI